MPGSGVPGNRIPPFPFSGGYMKPRIFVILLAFFMVYGMLQQDKDTSIATPSIQIEKIDSIVKPKKIKKIALKKSTKKPSELECLAKNIYYEAGNQDYEGRLAVATVTMNRVENKKFPSTVCGVVYQRSKSGCQFSWTCGKRGKFYPDLYKKSYAVAKEVLTNKVRLDIIKGALYFHNTSIKPKWTFAIPVARIGNHIFYIDKT